MKCFSRFVSFPRSFLSHLTIIAALGGSSGALAVGSMASVSVVDRETGQVLPTHYYRGEYWVAGKPGARYGIEVRNATGGRLLAVTSVDGINVVSGETAAWDQTGYVFAPGEQYEITGWRKSETHIAAFTFTDSSRSYASKTGRPANVGVIGVAVFRERVPVIEESARAAPEERERLAASSQLPSASSPSNADMTAANGPAARSRDSKLGTGHGAREYSYVVHTDFERLQPQPNEIIQIHYDSLDNLIAMGIVRRPPPMHRYPDPNPFPGSPNDEYVPDPPS